MELAREMNINEQLVKQTEKAVVYQIITMIKEEKEKSENKEVKSTLDELEKKIRTITK